MVRAALYPATWPSTNDNRGERLLHDALRRHLPAGFCAWHSLKVRDARGYDGEGDFVIADPKRGFVVIEVKGGRIEKRDGAWLQNGREMKTAPRDQAFSVANKLRATLNARGFSSVLAGTALCFPDIDSEQGLTQGDLVGLVLGARDLGQLEHTLPALFERALPKRDAFTPKAGWVDVLHELWDETWVPRMSLGVRAALEDEARVELDRAQLEVLDQWADNERLLVTGPAGSGKTLLAMEAARRSARTGAKTLLLCFTEALAQWLSGALEASGVTVRAVRRYADELLVQHGEEPVALDDAEAWERAPLDAAELVEKAGHGFEAVIVDEAQDLAEQDWLFVDALAKHARLWAFRDPSQAFWDDRTIDEQLFKAKNRLTRCYRNPEALWRVAQAYGGGQDLAPPPTREAVAQNVLAVVACPTEESVPNKVAAEVQRLRGEGFQPRDIAIVSLRGQRESRVLQALRLPGVPVARADDATAHDKLVVDTFLRFKGLERKVIVVVDLPVELDKRDKRLHIALTRALTSVRVVASREAIAADPVLRDAC
jgi:hypothetical protein